MIRVSGTITITFYSIKRVANCVLIYFNRFKMSRKCKVLASSVCFVVLLSVLFWIASFSPSPKPIWENGDNTSPEISLSFSNTTDVVCSLEDPQTKATSQWYPQYEPPNLKGPSLITFLQASSTERNRSHFRWLGSIFNAGQCLSIIN